MTLYTDAGATHNGFPDNQSFICVHDGRDVLLDQSIGNVSINVAEIMAIQEALVFAGTMACEIYSDSRLAVNLLTRRWKAHKAHLRALVDCIYLPDNVMLEWIPREDNPAGWHLEANKGV